MKLTKLDPAEIVSAIQKIVKFLDEQQIDTPIGIAAMMVIIDEMKTNNGFEVHMENSKRTIQ